MNFETKFVHGCLLSSFKHPCTNPPQLCRLAEFIGYKLHVLLKTLPTATPTWQPCASSHYGSDVPNQATACLCTSPKPWSFLVITYWALIVCLLQLVTHTILPCFASSCLQSHAQHPRVLWARPQCTRLHISTHLDSFPMKPLLLSLFPCGYLLSPLLPLC